jgi:hypothetical protein
MTITYPPTFFTAGEEMDADYLNGIVAKLPWGIVATPTSTASNGTATGADTTEVRDTTLTSYVFTAVAGRMYQVHYHGFLANSGTVNSRMIVRVRDGGASTPTTASTLLGEDYVYVTETSTAGRATGALIRTFTATAGTHTLSAFTQSPDSVVMTPVSTRELYVVDIGPA